MVIIFPAFVLGEKSFFQKMLSEKTFSKKKFIFGVCLDMDPFFENQLILLVWHEKSQIVENINIQ